MGELHDAEAAYRAMVKAKNGSLTGEEATSFLRDFRQIVARPVRWAWQDRIALGKITALVGRPKIGKGLLYSHIDQPGHERHPRG
jgi:hypothetical protein